MQHNDSIYQSEVNQSINSGLGLTPKRLVFENNIAQQATASQRKQAPFGTVQKDPSYANNRVPPIRLANDYPADGKHKQFQ